MHLKNICSEHLRQLMEKTLFPLSPNPSQVDFQWKWGNAIPFCSKKKEKKNRENLVDHIIPQSHIASWLAGNPMWEHLAGQLDFLVPNPIVLTSINKISTDYNC